MASTHISITGWTGCSYFQKAKTALLGTQVLVSGITVEVIEHPDRDTFRAWWTTKREVRQLLLVPRTGVDSGSQR